MGCGTWEFRWRPERRARRPCTPRTKQYMGRKGVENPLDLSPPTCTTHQRQVTLIVYCSLYVPGAVYVYRVLPYTSKFIYSSTLYTLYKLYLKAGTYNRVSLGVRVVAVHHHWRCEPVVGVSVAPQIARQNERHLVVAAALRLDGLTHRAPLIHLRPPTGAVMDAVR